VRHALKRYAPNDESPNHRAVDLDVTNKPLNHRTSKPGDKSPFQKSSPPKEASTVFV